jgi:hypothetical protein
MNQESADLWRQALFAYSYPIARERVERFGRRIGARSQWFNFDVQRGTRDETIEFEKRFRASAAHSVEPWFEVIFWKLASTGRLGETRAARMIEDLRNFKPSVPRMWAACSDFVASGTREAFRELQFSLFIVAGGIPVAATFPAFMAPERFPMVDSWIAKWVLRYRDAYPSDAAVAHLVAPSEAFTSGRRKTLVVSADWSFYCGWIDWCRGAARILSEKTGFAWRARDVEMAAFQNARSGERLLPAIEFR